MASVFNTEVMAENTPVKSRGFSIDWLVKGSLTKVGDIFDRLTGRGWKPSSSLATSELIERMKSLMDSEVRENGDKKRYVPHNIRLKIQWDKFSSDSEIAMKKLENEFLIAAVDHINDRHYYTYSPLSITVKPDYFTSGVVLLVSFDKVEAEDREAAVNVTVDGLKSEELVPEAVETKSGSLRARFEVGGKVFDKNIKLEEGKRISVGRTKENALQIDDGSISKAHASLLLNKEGKLVVADTGSTNGTFVRGERISYGKAFEVVSGTSLMFGLINVSIEFNVNQTAAKTEVLPAKTESYHVGEFEFATRPPSDIKVADQPAPTVASIPIQKETIAPIGKPEEPMPAKSAQRNEFSTNVAPQPGLSETDIKIQPENKGSDDST